jgi:hypothetical protein
MINLTQVVTQCHIQAWPKAQCCGLYPDLLYLTLPKVISAQHSPYKELQKMFCLSGKRDMIHFSDGDEDFFLNYDKALNYFLFPVQHSSHLN